MNVGKKHSWPNWT